MHCVLEGRVTARPGTACCGRFGCGMVRRVMETTYTVGVVAASMPRGGMCCGSFRNGMVVLGVICSVTASHRTTIVLARRPIDAAMVV
jgi:hypothetical protein